MKSRHKLDFYQTHEALTRALFIHCAVPLGGSVLEPCNGHGAISNVLKASGQFYSVPTNDIDPDKPADTHWDATQEVGWGSDSWNWVITNPPFSVAPKVLPLAYDHCVLGMAMLLRLTYLEPTRDRGAWLQQNPPSQVIVFNPRPKFREDTKGTDSATVAWFVWFKPALNAACHTRRAASFVFATDWQNLTSPNETQNPALCQHPAKP